MIWVQRYMEPWHLALSRTDPALCGRPVPPPPARPVWPARAPTGAVICFADVCEPCIAIAEDLEE